MNPLQRKFVGLLGEEWYEVVKDYLVSKNFKQVSNLLRLERNTYKVYPEQGSELLFKAFRTVPLSKVKVVILGQDPYHDGSYDGFAFSNTISREKPHISPSLKNILKEVESDVYKGLDLNMDPNLQRWAEQGVLLINTAHTVRKGQPASHLHIWAAFTQYIIHALSTRVGPMVWMLWGAKARRYLNDKRIQPDHLVLESPHPSPFSAASGFFGCKHFSKANMFLEEYNVEPIKW
jgi:uracil-DNA glycosylase